MNQCFSDNCKIGSGVPDLDEISDLLGIDKVSSSCLPDLMVQNYFEYESNSSEPILKGRLKSAVDFWRDELKAPPSVLSVLEHGVCLDFLRIPPSMEFKNNRSANKEYEFVNQAVSDLLKYNLILECNDKPYFVSPLSVAKNANKNRLILDLSHLNEFIKFERTKFEDHRLFFDLAQDCNYAFTFDIKSCYHQGLGFKKRLF